MGTTGEQRMPRTKIAKHKGPITNDVTGKDDKKDEVGKKQQRGVTKNIKVNF
jgi:hypothetical protein